MNDENIITEEHITHSADETQEIAATVAERIFTRGSVRTRATVVTLAGDLGAGKTTFAQGFLGACGANGPFTSPTFSLIKEYVIAHGEFTKVYHIDPYRVEAADLHALGFVEILRMPDAIILLEWPEIVASFVSDIDVRVQLSHVDEQARAITLRMAL